MIFRVFRLAPLALAGWRMFQNYKRRNAGPSRAAGTPPPQTYR